MFSLRPIFVLLAMLLTASASGQTRVSMVAPESRLWIEGRSTINEFECIAGRFDGHAILEPGSSEAEVVVPVKAFDCGKSRMNRDFYDALKAEEHPRIEFEFENVGLVSQQGAEFEVNVRGQLTIAGVTRDITLISEGRSEAGGVFRVSGRMPLSMHDFGITPPTALAGLIKAHDRIVVVFDLVATINATHASVAEVCGSDEEIFC